MDGRARLSNEWAPSGGIAVSKDEGMYWKNSPVRESGIET